MASRLGVKLRQLRRRRDMTQERLAERARLSQPYLALLESGERTPSLATLKRLARALEVEVGELLE